MLDVSIINYVLNIRHELAVFMPFHAVKMFI